MIKVNVNKAKTMGYAILIAAAVVALGVGSVAGANAGNSSPNESSAPFQSQSAKWVSAGLLPIFSFEKALETEALITQNPIWKGAFLFVRVATPLALFSLLILSHRYLSGQSAHLIERMTHQASYPCCDLDIINARRKALMARVYPIFKVKKGREKTRMLRAA